MILVNEMPTSGQFVAVWEWEECYPEELIGMGAKYIVLKLADY